MSEILAWCANVGGWFYFPVCEVVSDQWGTTISLAKEMVIVFNDMILCMM